jgi:hypothetical protein
MAGKKPTAAMVLSLIGGILILIGGIVTLAFASLTVGLIGGFTSILGAAAEALTISGAIGVVFGIIIVALSLMLSSKPNKHAALGAVILILSIISILDGGGFIIGLVLGLIGGILAIIWKG